MNWQSKEKNLHVAMWMALLGISGGATQAQAASTPKSSTLTVNCKVDDVLCQGTNGFFDGKLEWYSGNVLLFTEQDNGVGFDADHGTDKDVSIRLTGNHDAATFNTIYVNPDTTILTAPDLNWKLYNGGALMSAQKFSPVPSSVWSKHSEDTVGLQAEIDAINAAMKADEVADTAEMAAEAAARQQGDAATLAAAKAYADAGDAATLAAAKAYADAGDAATLAAAKAYADAGDAATLAAANAYTDAQVAAEAATRAAADTALNNAIAAESAARAAGDATLSSALAAETANRTAADAELANALATEASQRAAADAALSAAIAAEAANRAAAVSALSDVIAADEAQDTAELNAEANARASADSSLQSQIDTKQHNLAGQDCGGGQAVQGFDGNGNPICAAAGGGSLSRYTSLWQRDKPCGTGGGGTLTANGPECCGYNCGCFSCNCNWWGCSTCCSTCTACNSFQGYSTN